MLHPQIRCHNGLAVRAGEQGQNERTDHSNRTCCTSLKLAWGQFEGAFELYRENDRAPRITNILVKESLKGHPTLKAGSRIEKRALLTGSTGAMERCYTRH